MANEQDKLNIDGIIQRLLECNLINKIKTLNLIKNFV